MRRRAFIVIGLCAGLVIGCVATTALANGSTAAADPNTWTALNAIVNFASLVGGVLASVVAWAVRTMNARLKALTATLEGYSAKLDAYVDWQREQAEATKTNVLAVATKQNNHEVDCVREHGPRDGRPSVPEVPKMGWPDPPRRRSTDSEKTF